MSISLTGKDPSSYVRHSLHAVTRAYSETNCYVDAIIEMLHARGYEPLAMLAHIVRIDFEGDQWTFFKPPPEDVERLYGVDIHEMNPYRPLPIQIAEQLGLGRTMIADLDTWYLPDTAASSYRTVHDKTSCAFDLIDPERELLHYFHGSGLFALRDEDYRGVFRLGEVPEEVLSPYVEIVRFDAGVRLEGDALRDAALLTLRENLRRRPADNPVVRFDHTLGVQLPALLAGELEMYHAYAFATVRILGSGFEALASFCEWLFGDGAGEVIEAMMAVVAASKVLSFRLARRRAFDRSALLTQLALAYEQSLGGLERLAA